MKQALVEPLQGIFSCNLHMMGSGMFVRGFMVAKWTENMSISLQSFRSCIDPQWRLETLTRCLVPLIEKCRRSEVVAVKVIRLHMSYVDQLLSDDPDLRLIHVVRDPRGLLESWRKLYSKPSQYSMYHRRQLDAKIMCQRMVTDCRIRRQLESKYPRRILLLRYEDLVTATDTVIGDIYNGLLQMALPSNIIDVIKQQMHAASDNGVTGTQRKNGTATATNWRRTINRALLDYITDKCRPLLDELRYQL